MVKNSRAFILWSWGLGKNLVFLAGHGLGLGNLGESKIEGS